MKKDTVLSKHFFSFVFALNKSKNTHTVELTATQLMNWIPTCIIMSMEKINDITLICCLHQRCGVHYSHWAHRTWEFTFSKSALAHLNMKVVITYSLRNFLWNMNIAVWYVCLENIRNIVAIYFTLYSTLILRIKLWHTQARNCILNDVLRQWTTRV